MSELIEHTARVPTDLALKRLDHIAVAMFPQYSRSRLQQWIESGELTVDGARKKPKYKVSNGAHIRILAKPDISTYTAEDIHLDIVHEDEALLVLNKPAGFVVHPGAGNPSGTILNALLHHRPSIGSVPRAGIVHRLDKDTTGLMVVAKTLASQNHLVQQLQSREVKRIYEAITYGVAPRSGKVEAAIGRHPHMRTKMSVQVNGKEAITHYRLLKAYIRHARVQLSLETGRTHQIRVHMQHLGYPLVGDPTYGGTFRTPPNQPDESLAICLKNFPRQALHARNLSFVHPATQQVVEFEREIPADMQNLIDVLDRDVVDRDVVDRDVIDRDVIDRNVVNHSDQH